MAGLSDTIYRNSPVWVQNVGVSLYGYRWKRQRLGGVFQEETARFAARDRWDVAQFREYQEQRLRELLAHADAQVPYYRDAFQSVGLSAADLANFSLDELRRLPILEKNTIRANPDALVAQNAAQAGLHTMHTSGSTGTPMAIKVSSRTHQLISAAYEARCRYWAGLNHKMSRAMIGGRLVVPKAQSTPPFWRYNAAERQLYFSAFHISPGNLPAYAGALNKFKPDYLVGYASAHFFLARMFHEAGIRPHSPRAVLTSSEKLTDEMRAIISAVYRCEVFDGYSGVENCCLASECEHHRLHVSPDVGILEILDEAGENVRPGEVGEIVATGLLNFDQPLIRYRTGDFAIWAPEGCPCGRAMPVLRELVGRLEDTVIGLDGRETVRFHGLYVGIPRIRSGQVVQETREWIRIRVIAPEGLTDQDRETVISRVRERLGPVRVDVEVTDAPELSERGKFRAVISKVPRSSAGSQPKTGSG